MAKKKKKVKRRRTTSEKVIIVLGIIIALSMILSLVAGLGSRSRGANSSSSLPEDTGVPIALVVGSSPDYEFMSAIGVAGDLYRT
ncbi:MAG: hypothetical protein WA996_24785 [Candidatus Promineifilaceae bacterium]